MPYADGDSFTTIADVQARWQRGAFSGTTNPTTDQVRAFMQKRSTEIQAILLEAGLTYTVSTGGSPFPGSGTTAQNTLRDMCALANELAAAGDATAAHDSVQGTGSPEEAQALWREADSVRKKIRSVCEALFNTASNRSHTKSGGISGTDYGTGGTTAESDQSDLWSLGTKF